MGWKIHQMYVKTTFLNGFIEEEVYIEQPEGFETFDRESHVCKLKRELYGLKKEPHACDEQLIKSCKEDLAREFEIKDMGLMYYFLELEVWQGDGETFVSQGKYANEILQRFHMDSCKPMETPLATNWRKEDATLGEEVDATIYRQLVGSLMYLVNTQPNMCYAVNNMRQAMVRPTKLFWRAAKHVLQYLRGITQFGLWYIQTEGVTLCGFTDSDWARSP
eukprot:PITA_31242